MLKERDALKELGNSNSGSKIGKQTVYLIV
jgi:hypothetical protein